MVPPGLLHRASQNAVAAVALLGTLLMPSIDGIDKVYR
jgi:hypothetical protein